LSLSIAEAQDVAVGIVQSKIARPRHIFHFLGDTDARGAATAAKFVDIVIDVTIKAYPEGPIALVFGKKEAQIAALYRNTERKAGCKPMLGNFAKTETAFVEFQTGICILDADARHADF
jgi:hypothetical protein